MWRLRVPALLVPLLLAACDGREPVSVRITPAGYSVGMVQSALATPAVDEVVRLNPKRLVVMLCPSASVKLAQFNSELDARLKIAQELSMVKDGCAEP